MSLPLQNPERLLNYEEVIVTEITTEGTFYAQSCQQGPKAEELIAKLRQEFQVNPPLPGAYNPKRGDICAAKYSVDDQWYRAKVEKVQGSNVSIRYIDYGNKETVQSTRLASLPAIYANEKPFAVEYSLACVSLPKDSEFAELALKYLREDLLSGRLLLNVEYRAQGMPPATTLLTEQNVDVIKNIISDGLLLVEKRKERRLNKLVSIDIQNP